MSGATRVLLALLVLLAAGCGDLAPEAAADDGRLRVVSTMSVFSDFAEAVGGDLVAVETLVEVGGDPHTYEPGPRDAAVITDADVVLDNGLGLSPWFAALSENVTGELVVLTAGIAEQAVEASGKVDPHMWMVPEYVDRGYVTAIEEAFAAADPANARTYRANADAYRGRLAELDAELRARFATIPAGNRKLVTSHDAYSYFADHYGFEVLDTIVGVTTEEEPSAETVARVVDTVRAAGVPTIFVETTVNPDLVEQVARDAGVAVGTPLYGDSVGEEGSGAETYEGMMRANAAAITTGLDSTGLGGDGG